MLDARALDRLYAHYDNRRFVAPDPLQFLYEYPATADREIVAVLASSLAFGNVKQIIASVGDILTRIGPPRHFLRNLTTARLAKSVEGFRHRFAGQDEVAGLLAGMAGAVAEHGGLEAAFMRGYSPQDANLVPALAMFRDGLMAGKASTNCLLPDPAKESACKRWHLFLRWMVRSDAVDPGGWDALPACKLLYPVDTHIARFAMRWGLTRRRQAGRRMAVEITSAFQGVCLDDPVKYDFALTRPGIRGDSGPVYGKEAES